MSKLITTENFMVTKKFIVMQYVNTFVKKPY